MLDGRKVQEYTEMIDPIRRKILESGPRGDGDGRSAARVFAEQELGREALPCPSTRKGPVRIRYQEAGSGFPFLSNRRWGAEFGDLRLDHRSL